MTRRPEPEELTARIPADVDRPDEILFGLTARQVAVLAVVAVGLLAAWRATRTLLPPAVAGGVAVVVAAAAVTLVAGRRDGLGLDELLLAAVRQRPVRGRCRRRCGCPHTRSPRAGWWTWAATASPWRAPRRR